MSKKSWLPTQKGTELFPNVIQAPATLRIKDVEPGTELYTAVAQEYAGQLKQFHAKAQQTHALSVNLITKVRQRLGPEATATYTNIHGNETVELQVSRSTLSKFGEISRPLPQWALARFDIPILIGDIISNTPYTNSFAIYGVLRGSSPVIDSLEVGDGNLHFLGEPWFKPFKLMAFSGTASDKFAPGTDATTISGTDSEFDTMVFELLIDLRPFWTPTPRAAALVIDIYASAERNDPNHLYGYFNQATANTTQDDWITNADISAAPAGAGALAYYQSFWDAAGLPHSQQSYFVDKRDGNGALELVVHPSQANGSITYNRDGSYATYPPIITQGLPNFITNQPAGATVDGWRYMVIETDPVSGLITKWGYNNLIWETLSGDPFPTIFTLTTGMTVHHYNIEPNIGYINNPYPGPGNVRGVVYWDDRPLVEQALRTGMNEINWRWVTPGVPLTDHPLLAQDVPWPNEFLPSPLFGPPSAITQPQYKIGSLIVDIETGSMGFQKAL